MEQLKRLAALVVLSSTVLMGGAAHAMDDGDIPVLDERTARTVGAGTLKLGILAFDYGIIDRLSVGTDPPAWAARAVFPVFIPNLHFKGIVWDRERYQIAVQVAGYYARLDDDSSSGHLLAVPVSLFASRRMQERWWLHGEGTYNFVQAIGAGNIKDADLNGNVATRTVQLGAMVEFRVRPWIALTASARYQIYSGPLAFSGDSMLDPYTTVNVDGQATPRVEHPWQAIAGVAFLWKWVHLAAGVGYGYYFVPGMDIAYPKETIIPDLSASVWL
jgi:hypothetical protein